MILTLTIFNNYYFFVSDCAYSGEELERQYVPLYGGHFTGLYSDGNTVDHPGDCYRLHRLEGISCCLYGTLSHLD